MKTRPQTASLLMLRRRDDPEVYWVRRADGAFLSGFHAFPGGALEPSDHDVPVHGAIGLEAAVRVAALREVLEETGVLAAPGFGGPTPPGWREAVRAGRRSFADVVAEAGVRLAADELAFAGCWTAPEYLGRAFDTWFFAAWIDEDAAPRVQVEDGELAGGEWIRPAEAVRRWLRSEVILAPPTLALLRALVAGARPESPAPFLALPEARGTPARSSATRPHVTLFPLRTPTLPPATHTNAYVIGTEELGIVDPASSDVAERAALDAYVLHRIEAGARPKAVLLTHHHHDHVGGVAHLAARFSIPVYAHAETAKRVPFRVHEHLVDGDVVTLGRHRLRCLHTPGHAPGHLCYVDEDTGTAVVGDMVAGVGTILVEPDEGSMTQYLDSLARLRDLPLTALLPSHGPVIGAPRHKLSAYIEHRLMREGRVLEAVASGLSTLDQMIPVVYEDVDRHAWPLARLSLKAHLVKLVDEGRVQEQSAEHWVSRDA